MVEITSSRPDLLEIVVDLALAHPLRALGLIAICFVLGATLIAGPVGAAFATCVVAIPAALDWCGRRWEGRSR